jgi:D-mannonate dehydratase
MTQQIDVEAELKKALQAQQDQIEQAKKLIEAMAKVGVKDVSGYRLSRPLSGMGKQIRQSSQRRS